MLCVDMNVSLSGIIGLADVDLTAKIEAPLVVGT